jgi:hypothetical protein
MSDVPVAVWVKSSSLSEKEQAFVNSLGPHTILNARFFRATIHDKVSADKVYNLSGNKEIDKFYADVLVSEKVVIDPTTFNETGDDEEKEQVQEEAEEVATTQPIKRGRPAKTHNE